MSTRVPIQRLLDGILNQLSGRVGPLVPNDSRARFVLRAIRARIPTGEHSDPLNQVMLLFARAHPKAFVIQVGANDGRQRDPLRRHIYARSWGGILVEPVPYVFNRLRTEHACNPRLVFENVAISDHDGAATLWHLRQSADPSLPQWYDALASFHREVLLKHREFIPDIEDRIAPIEVPCTTFDTLCARHSLSKIDVIQIDTEGYDFEVIKLIDFERYQPKVIMYENLHLEPEIRQNCESHLRQHGYELLSDIMDTVGVHSSVLRSVEPLSSLWAALNQQRDGVTLS